MHDAADEFAVPSKYSCPISNTATSCGSQGLAVIPAPHRLTALAMIGCRRHQTLVCKSF